MIQTEINWRYATEKFATLIAALRPHINGYNRIATQLDEDVFAEVFFDIVDGDLTINGFTAWRLDEELGEEVELPLAYIDTEMLETLVELKS